MKSNAVKKINVLLVAPSMRITGGQAVQAKRLFDAFARNEQIRIIFLPNNPELKTFSFLQKIKFIRTLAASLKFWFSLFKETGKADVVHVFSAAMTGYLIATLPPLFFAKLCGKKAILNYHSGDAEQHIENWKLSALPTMKKFDEVVVPSQFLVDVFARYNLQAKAIFNSVETEKFVFRARTPLKPVFLSNRNFEAHYRVADCLRAFQLISEKISEAELIVAGFGSEEAQLKKLTQDLRLKNVEFVGRVEQDQMPEIYNRADVYLNSSVVDNMPLSIIEAFACGLPVVSTDAGGISYIVKDGKNGVLVKTKDFENLANKAIQLLENQGLANRLIENARNECEKYSAEKVKENWTKLYLRLSKKGE